jgi:ADP-ribosylglycohydrolase
VRLSVDVVAERVRQEIDARVLQGYAVDGMREEWERVARDTDGLLALSRRLQNLPLREGWPYHEPSDLESIRESRPEPEGPPPLYLAEEELCDKIHGAWLGRIAGCVLGKPLEDDYSQDDIRRYLEGADAYPLRDYVPAQSRTGQVLRRDCVPSMRGYVRYAQEDDDINYMCLAVKLLETRGLAFTTLDVGMNWLGSVPFLWTWGSAHTVYLNLATVVGEHTAGDVDLEAVTGYLNPGIEHISAQIRSDVYGMVCPHSPAVAAELAWRDAYLTHRKSGIYGAMWVAAMIAAAFTLLDMEVVIRMGLAQIPKESRFAEAIQRTIAWCRIDGDWRVTGSHIVELYDDYTGGGAINNACVVTAALLYGWGDGTASAAERFERTITTAVQLGYDTDCNAATAGSVVGIMLGANQLPEKWIAPLHDTMRTCVAGFGQERISAMARRTYVLSKIVRSAVAAPAFSDR